MGSGKEWRKYHNPYPVQQIDYVIFTVTNAQSAINSKL